MKVKISLCGDKMLLSHQYKVDGMALPPVLILIGTWLLWSREVVNFAPLEVLEDIAPLAQPFGRIVRYLVAKSSSPHPPLPLLTGSERFVDPYYYGMHSAPTAQDPFDVACYFIKNATISGAGNVWIDDSLIVSPEIMPGYVQTVLDLQNGGSADLRRSSSLPLRTIQPPCLVATGHGIQVYGHFLVEMLFRLLIVQRAFGATRPLYKVLLEKSVPQWLLRILIEDLHISRDSLEFFDPNLERVLLSQAIIPTTISRNERFHNIANELLNDVIDRLQLAPKAPDAARVFVMRRSFLSAHSPQRVCLNEKRLVMMAENEFHFKSIVPEELTWRQQISLFRDAEIIVGQAGSGLHTALFSRAGTRLASIGVMNFTQSGIGALRQQHNAYFEKGIHLNGEFSVPEDSFLRFLSAVCG
jgi:capsular polysaccharide biosynthesis protein